MLNNFFWSKLIFDGPIDIGWIENMNTVLDDNKKLCLNSGEVISMTPEMSIIFEVIDVNQAAPSTISRCGMVHTDVEIIGWKAMVASWISKCNVLWTGDWKPFLDGLMLWICPQVRLTVVICVYFFHSKKPISRAHTRPTDGREPLKIESDVYVSALMFL